MTAAAKAVEAHPEKSDRAIAAEIGVAPNTVKAARTAQNCAVKKRTGLDGKARKQPTRAPAQPKDQPAADVSIGNLIARMQTGLSLVCLMSGTMGHVQPADMLKSCNGDRDEIEALFRIARAAKTVCDGVMASCLEILGEPPPDDDDVRKDDKSNSDPARPPWMPSQDDGLEIPEALRRQPTETKH
jgi:hypothetical protein